MLASHHTHEKTKKQQLTLALAILQFVQALGVTESGTFLLLPPDVVGLGLHDACSEVIGLAEVVELDGDDGWTSCTDWSEVSVAEVSKRLISGSASVISAMATASTIVAG